MKAGNCSLLNLRRDFRKGKKRLAIFIARLLRGSEHVTLVIQAFVVGILAGAANVMFRAAMGLAHTAIFVGGSRLLHISEGGAFKALVPLLPIAGAILLIPLSIAFPGEVNGYGFSKFLEVVNVRGGVIRLRNIFLKTLDLRLQ